MVNYRGIAVNRQLDETSTLVSGWNRRLDASNTKHLQRTDELGWGSPQWRTSITSATPNNALELVGINPLDSEIFRSKGRGSTQKMFNGFHGFMSRITKSVNWDFLMRHPSSWAAPYAHPVLDSRLSESYVNGMCRLSDSFFLKYAWHVEGEQNVWDVQYRGLSISDNFPLNSVMRLPYPVMWFDAPSGGYTLEPPKKRLFNKLEKSGIDLVYKKKIGGIMLMEVDILPVVHDVPNKGQTSLALKNMLWQIPDVQYGGEVSSKTPMHHPTRGKFSIAPGDVTGLASDYELTSFLLGGYDMQKVTDRSLFFSDLDNRTALEKNVISILMTHPLPMSLVEESMNCKEQVADMIWDVANTTAKNHCGLVLSDSEYEIPNIDNFGKEMREQENGFITIRYDGIKDRLNAEAMHQDDHAVREMFHVRIDNFPTENNSVQGVMLSRRINPLAGELDEKSFSDASNAMTDVIIDLADKHDGSSFTSDDYVEKRASLYTRDLATESLKTEFLTSQSPATSSSVNKRRNHLSFASNSDSLLLPQFMVTGFNDESVRSEGSMQGWTRPDYQQMYMTKGNSPHNFKNVKQAENYLGSRLDRLILNLTEENVRNDSMRLVWPMWRALRDDFYGEEMGWEPFFDMTQISGPPEGSIASSIKPYRLAWPFTRCNAMMGLRYNATTHAIDHCVDSCFASLEEFGTSDKGHLLEHLFPDFDEEKDHIDLFLSERKKEVKDAEVKKLQKILALSDETAFEHKEYGDTDSIKNMLVRSKTYCNVPYDTYNFINDDNIMRQIVSSYLNSKYWIAKHDAVQHFVDEYPREIDDGEEVVANFWEQGRNKGPLCTTNSMSIAMSKSLRLAYADTLRWHKNEAEMGRKLILASVYSVDGDILMQLPIPPADSFGKLTKYANAIWAHHEISSKDEFAELMKEALEEKLQDGYDYPEEVISVSTDCDLVAVTNEDTWIEGGNTNTAFPDYTRKRLERMGVTETVKATTGMNLDELEQELVKQVGNPSTYFNAKNQAEYLEAHKHFGKETIKLVIGLLEFMNRPEVHIDPRPFAVRRGARLRGKGNKYKAERIDKDEDNLMRKNHVLRRTGVVKKYLDMAPITDSRGKMKRHYVPTHSRMQPYPTRGTIEKIWVDGYFRGDGEMTSRPRIKIVDKRTHGGEE